MRDEQITAFIEHLLIEKNKTQSDIAKEIGVSRQVIWHLFNQKGTIHLLTRKKIERYAKKLGYIA